MNSVISRVAALIGFGILLVCPGEAGAREKLPLEWFEGRWGEQKGNWRVALVPEAEELVYLVDGGYGESLKVYLARWGAKVEDDWSSHTLTIPLWCGKAGTDDDYCTGLGAGLARGIDPVIQVLNSGVLNEKGYFFTLTDRMHVGDIRLFLQEVPEWMELRASVEAGKKVYAEAPRAKVRLIPKRKAEATALELMRSVNGLSTREKVVAVLGEPVAEEGKVLRNDSHPSQWLDYLLPLRADCPRVKARVWIALVPEQQFGKSIAPDCLLPVGVWEMAVTPWKRGANDQ